MNFSAHPRMYDSGSHTLATWTDEKWKILISYFLKISSLKKWVQTLNQNLCFFFFNFISRKYPKVCLPFLMLTKHEISIEDNLVRQMGDQWLVAQLKECVLKLMVHILPYSAVSHYQVNDEKMQKKIAAYPERYKLLLKRISKEVSWICPSSWKSWFEEKFFMKLGLCL